MKVTIRKWKKIKSITKLSDKYMKYPGSNIVFTPDMKHLCGKTIEVRLYDDEFITKEDWYIAPWMCKGGKF